MQPSTISAVIGASGDSCSPISDTAQTSVISGWASWIWLALGTPMAAMPRYLEDDFARRLAHADSPPLPPPLAADDPDGVVIHIRSLTKATSPNLRVGAITARGPAFERLRAAQVIDTFFVPRSLQETALELVGAPAWTTHHRALATALRDRRAAILTALSRLLPGLAPQHPPLGGYHLWLRLPDGTDEATVAAAALRHGVAVTAGSPYFSADTSTPHLRLSYVSPASTGQLEAAIRRLHHAYTQIADQESP